MALDINEMNKMFVVEWSTKGKNSQIQVLGEILKSNLLAALKGRNSGYFPVAIAHTEAEALKMSEIIEAKLKKRGHRGESSDTLH